MIRLRRGLLILLLALVAPGQAWARDVEVVVGLDGPGLAPAVSQSRVLSSAARAQRLDLDSPTSREYIADLATRQLVFERALRRTIPSARVRWRYRVVLNGVAVVLPRRDVARLARVPGVRTVYPNVRYAPMLDRSPALIGAPTLWNDALATRGDGIKIGVLDDGIDQTHAFFAPTGYAMPPGFPKGDTAWTTAKVIVARAFPPPGITWRNAPLPFDAIHSGHATHVAGIAAGNANTVGPNGVRLSGVAPRAYLGNYKVLTVPTEQFGLNGNAPEIVRGIEAAVADGMDVINLSLGQPEVEPTRDVVALALDAAAAAGVVPVVAAGNDFGNYDRGSIGSPGTSARAITVAATGADRIDTLAGFSSAGPTPISHRLKPDVAAPGSSILSSFPSVTGMPWGSTSGTSMAAPHVAGGVALLRQRHPSWTVDQLKSALIQTGRGLQPLRAGGGAVNLVEADRPLVFAEPPSLSFGLVRPGQELRAEVRLTDAGGGAGAWTGTANVTVPGTLVATIRVPTSSAEGQGFLELRRGATVRRIPYWFRAVRPRLPRPSRTLVRAGTFRGSTLGRPARVPTYRYPESRGNAGPEQVFRFVLRRPVANFGVAVLSGRVQPRIVAAGDENRVAGYAGQPGYINPYARRFGQRDPIAGAIVPRAGAYDLVFDSRRRRGSRFTFRFWVDDRTPPALRMLTPVARGGVLRVRAVDRGAGVDPRSIEARVGGLRLNARYARGIVMVDVSPLRRGRHALELRVSDHQEAKNNENVGGVLPNTRLLRVRFTR